jgi:hypothetical protein
MTSVSRRWVYVHEIRQFRKLAPIFLFVTVKELSSSKDQKTPDLTFFGAKEKPVYQYRLNLLWGHLPYKWAQHIPPKKLFKFYQIILSQNPKDSVLHSNLPNQLSLSCVPSQNLASLKINLSLQRLHRPRSTDRKKRRKRNLGREWKLRPILNVKRLFHHNLP